MHPVTDTIHQYIRPVIVVITGTTGYLKQMITVIVTAISRITAIQIGIIFRTHAAAASPAFISYTEIFYFPCLVSAILATQICHWRITVGSHVLHPFGEFFYRAAAYVSTYIWFAAQHFAKVQKFVCSETVVFNRSSPVVVHHLRAVFFGTDTVHPVIFVCKAAARPAENRNRQVF